MSIDHCPPIAQRKKLKQLIKQKNTENNGENTLGVMESNSMILSKFFMLSPDHVSTITIYTIPKMYLNALQGIVTRKRINKRLQGTNVTLAKPSQNQVL